MDVSIIIVNYRTVPLILDCLASVYALTIGVDYEIIVVDNNSGDGFQERIQERFPEVVCLPLSENIGFGRANNEGLKIARGRNIFFLNPDTLLLNNAVKILSDYLNSHPEAGICGGNLYDADMKPAHSYMVRLPGIGWEVNNLLHGIPNHLRWGQNTQFNRTGHPMKVGYITGADMMVRRAILDKVGSFSPSFFMYYEETELTFRIKSAGYCSVSVPQAEIQHLEGRSLEGDKWKRKQELMMVSRKTYYSLCHSFTYTFLAEFLFRLHLLSRMVLFFCISRQREARRYLYCWRIAGRKKD